jgi:hypothetical protein
MKEHEDDLARIIVGFFYSLHIYTDAHPVQTLENGKTLAEAKVGGDNTERHIRLRSNILRVKMLTVPLSSRWACRPFSKRLG